MNFKSVSTKLTVHEAMLVKSYCEKKGATPASLIRDLLLHEIKVPIPQNIAGKNIISYDKGKDTFDWDVILDSNEEINILKDLSAEYLEDLKKVLDKSLEERTSAIKKKKKDSVSIPSKMLGNGL